MTRPLDAIRVIDTTTGPVGGIASMVLADFGADVVKVEPPGGDRFRSLPGSPLWLRGKRSVILDLHAPTGLEQLHDLVRTADVLIVGGPPERARRWGVDADAATLLQPSLVHCSITGWGERGALAHLPGYVSAVAARGGRMMAFGGQILRPGPVYAAVPVAGHVAAHGAVQGILAGLLCRARTGRPQRVTTSLLQSLLPFDLVEMLLVQLAERTGTAPPANPGGADMPTLNYHPVRTADGQWIQCGNLLEHLFLSFLEAIDLYPELLSDEDGRFLPSPAEWTPDAVEHARDRILERMQEKTAAEWMAIFHADGNVAAEPFRTPAEALCNPDLVANGSIVELDDPQHGRVRMIGAIASLSDTPAVIEQAAPRPGEHGLEILSAQKVSAQKVSAQKVSAQTGSATMERRAVTTGRPLDGTTVIEFASVIAAPLGASMLADLGARVIRVEPLEGDSFRHLLPNGLMAVKTTAGKESICLDLKHPEGRAIARKLLASADVLLHNYRPGVPERLGIGYDQLHAELPRLVWVAVNGYGPHGPSTHRPATHPVAGASMGGAGYQAGAALTRPCPTLADVRENARQIMRANEPSPDPNTAVIVASATLLALVARGSTGEGQAVHVDMLCANAHANADAFLAYDAMAPRPAVDEGLYGTGPWHRLYPCASGWVFLAATTQAEQARFAEATGWGVLPVDPALLTDALGALLATRAAGEWEALLGANGVACVIADEATPGRYALQSAHMIDNGFVPLTQHARFGSMRRWGPIVTVDGGAASYGPGVLAGEDTDAILAGLGYGEAERHRLREAGIVTSEPVTL